MVPPLRDRAGDIAAAGASFHRAFRGGREQAGRGPDARGQPSCSERFNWPGNVRQLENTIFRAVVLCDGTLLDVCDFPQIAAAMGVEAVARQNACADAAGRRRRALAAPPRRLRPMRCRRPTPPAISASSKTGIRDHPHGDRPL